MTALITREAAPALVGVAMMNQVEARYTVERIKTHFDDVRRLLLDLEEREGWRALGYTSWRECAAAEFGQSQAYLYRQLTAAKIEQAIDSPIGEIPESHLRPLARLDTPTEQRAALDRADQLAGSEARTAKHVQQAVNEIKPAAPRLCDRCGKDWGKPGSMIVGAEKLCQDCAAARLSSGQPFRSVESEAQVRRCGRCNKPADSLTGYGEGVIPEYPNGITLCHPCIVELLREQRKREQLAPPPCASCSKPSTTRETIGGLREARCDACTIDALVRERADRVVAESDNPIASAQTFLATQTAAMRQWDNSALPSRREHEAALAYIAALLRLLTKESTEL